LPIRSYVLATDLAKSAYNEEGKELDHFDMLQKPYHFFKRWCSIFGYNFLVLFSSSFLF